LNKEAVILDQNTVQKISSQTEKRTSASLTALVVTCCFLIIMAEGYDLGIYGAVLPKLLEYKEWALTPVQAGAIASYALVGMLIGAVLVGTITDLIGRKWTLISCLAIFSITMGLAAMASTPELFGLSRFIGGIALGGCIPTASALTVEYSPAHRRSLLYAIMYAGYPIGGVLGALLSLLYLNEYGWRFLFWLGLIPVILVPFLIWKLPESISFLLSRRRDQEAEAICRKYQIELPTVQQEDQHKPVSQSKLSAISILFSKTYLRATIFFWITFFMGLLLVYGLNTWIPKLMVKAGYPLGSSLSLLIMLNFTAAIGALIAGVAADRWGSKRVISVSYFLAGVSIALLSSKPSTLFVYALIGIAGFGSTGTTLILNAYITKYFPTHARATALGWALGFGRLGAISGPILGGLLMAWQVDINTNFYIFALAGFIASISTRFIPKEKGGMI